MELTLEHAQQMEGIIAQMQSARPQCRKDYQCYRSDLENLCQVKGIGVFNQIECASEENRCCGFSQSYLGEKFCGCQLRRYIAANFRR